MIEKHGNHDLSPIWINDCLQDAINSLRRLELVYNQLSDKNTSYALGYERMITLRMKIIACINQFINEQEQPTNDK